MLQLEGSNKSAEQLGDMFDVVVLENMFKMQPKQLETLRNQLIGVALKRQIYGDQLQEIGMRLRFESSA
jgi:hypothetical protein